MTYTKIKFLRFSVIAASVATALLIDASAHAAEGRVRRGGSTPVVTAPQAAPGPASVSSAPTVCYETEVLPATGPAEVVVDEGRRRGRSSTQAAPVRAQQPIVITKIVPCPTEASSTPPVGAYTPPPGLLGPTLVASLPGELEQPSLSQQVPEPSILALFGVGALGIAVARRRRRA